MGTGWRLERCGWRIIAAAAAAACLLAGATAQRWVARSGPGPFAGGQLFSDPATGNLFAVGGDGPKLRTWRRLASVWHYVEVNDAPSQRSGSAAVYDPIRGKAVLFGGWNGSTPLSDTWEFDGNAWQLIATATMPAPRNEHSLTYDAQRGKVVMFGGNGLSGRLDDTWEFDGTDWTRIVTANSPSRRAGAAMAYDAPLARTLLFGGFTDLGESSETWTYDGVDWTQLPLPAPLPRRSACMTYDVARSRMVLYGGSSLYPPRQFTDTWEFVNGLWQVVLGAQSPPGFFDGAQTYDWSLGRVVHLGGGTGTLLISQTLSSFDGTTWVPETDDGDFFRNDAALAFDRARERLILHGGRDENGILRNETFEWSPAGWQCVQVGSGPLTPATLVYDPLRQVTLALEAGTTWQYDGSSWQTVPTAQPAPTGRPYYDPVVQRLRVVASDRLWTFDGAQWQSSTASSPPPGSSAGQVVYHTARDRLLSIDVQGGAGYWFDGQLWTPALLGLPASFAGSSLVYDSTRGIAISVDASADRIATFEDSRQVTLLLERLSAVPPQIVAESSTGRVFAVTRSGSVWQLVWPDSPSLTRHGRGCAGSAGVPRLDELGATAPRLGLPMPLRLDALPGTPGLFLLALGSQIASASGLSLPLPLDGIGLPGCLAWVPPEATAVFAHPGTATTLSLAIPASPAIAGSPVALQALVVDPAASNGFGAVSNAVVAIAW